MNDKNGAVLVVPTLSRIITGRVTLAPSRFIFGDYDYFIILLSSFYMFILFHVSVNEANCNDVSIEH